MWARAILAAMLLIVGPPAQAQESPFTGSCDLTRYGIEDPESFLLFDRELRHALSTLDASTMTMLVSFPLSVNRIKGSNIKIDTPASLKRWFLELFPPSVRSAVLEQKLDDLICNTGGIAYGRGTVWINPASDHIGVMAINLPPEQGSDGNSAAERIEFVCEARKIRVMVDTDQAGSRRLRVWNKPRSIVERPDLEISSGEMKYEGTSPCTHPIWKFRDGDVEYTLSEIGCYPESSPPPEGARGTVDISGINQPREERWCY